MNHINERGIRSLITQTSVASRYRHNFTSSHSRWQKHSQTADASRFLYSYQHGIAADALFFRISIFDERFPISNASYFLCQ